MSTILIGVILIGVLVAVFTISYVANHNYRKDMNVKGYEGCKTCKSKSCSKHPEYDPLGEDEENEDDRCN